MEDDGEDLLRLPSLAPMRICLARARPMTTGSTASRWLGLETRWSAMVLPLGEVYSPVAPMWYLTSPPPRTLRGSTSSKLGEDLGGRAADGVGHDVEAAAMAHGEDGAC